MNKYNRVKYCYPYDIFDYVSFIKFITINIEI